MSRRITLLVLWAVIFLGACQQEENEIRTYRVSKDVGSAMPMAGAPMMGSIPTSPGGLEMAPAANAREIEWTLPAGWKEQPPSAMRVGSFLAKASDGTQADISIVPLTGEAGGDLANINRWRGQINLPPITEADLPRNSQSMTANGRSMLLVDFVGPADKRLVSAIYKQGERTWFFKMMGTPKALEETKPAFLQFLKTLRFHDHA